MTEHIQMAVRIDGQTVYPEGWMFVLAFALRGVEWAVKDALDPAFNMDGKVRDYYRRQSIYFAEKEIAALQELLTTEKSKLELLNKIPVLETSHE